MSLAEPLEVPETEVVMSTLQNLQSQVTAAQTLIAFLRGRRAGSDYALVEEQLQKADAHLQEAVNSMRSKTMPLFFAPRADCPEDQSPSNKFNVAHYQ